jgi:Fe-S cluster assembly ATPase SufC
MRGEAPKVRTWIGEVKDAMSALGMDPAFSERSVNEVSLAEKRNGMRSCNLNCLNQKLRSWMKLTQG